MQKENDRRERFDRFYREYLGINSGIEQDGIFFCQSKYRELPINKKYYYETIATIYQGQKLISIAENGNVFGKEFHKEAEEYFCLLQGEKRADAWEMQVVNDEGSEREKRCMYYRMLLGDHPQYRENRLQMSQDTNIEFIYLKEQKKYMALSGEVIVGYCKISDVIEGFGNLVIWVEEKYRERKIASNLLALLLERCEEEGIEPMYYVKEENIPSIRLASHAGFEIVQKEVVVYQ